MSLQIPQQVPVARFYYHYKHDPQGSIGNYAYEVTGVGFHTENEEHFVIYRPLYSAAVYQAAQNLKVPCFDVRPLAMWMGQVEKDGQTVARFQEVTDPEVVAALGHISNQMYPSVQG
jgi:hypothetical protein